jgi:hypothetical protein
MFHGDLAHWAGVQPRTVITGQVAVATARFASRGISRAGVRRI